MSYLEEVEKIPLIAPFQDLEDSIFFRVDVPHFAVVSAPELSLDEQLREHGATDGYTIIGRLPREGSCYSFLTEYPPWPVTIEKLPVVEESGFAQDSVRVGVSLDGFPKNIPLRMILSAVLLTRYKLVGREHSLSPFVTLVFEEIPTE